MSTERLEFLLGHTARESDSRVVSEQRLERGGQLARKSQNINLPSRPNCRSPFMSEEQLIKKRKIASEPDKDLDLAPPLHNLLIKKHSEKARTPTRGSALAAGYDLYRLDITAPNFLHTPRFTYATAQKTKSSHLGGKPSSIPRFRSRSPLEHTDASLREVVSVRRGAVSLQIKAFNVAHGDSSIEVRYRYRCGRH